MTDQPTDAQRPAAPVAVDEATVARIVADAIREHEPELGRREAYCKGCDAFIGSYSDEWPEHIGREVVRVLAARDEDGGAP